MPPEPALHEKLTRIWSLRRERYVLLRVRYATGSVPSVLQLLAVEELEERY